MDAATMAQMLEVARELDASQGGTDWQTIVLIGVPIWTAVAAAAAWVYRKGKALVDSEQACLRAQGVMSQWMEWACHEIKRLGGDTSTMPPIPRAPKTVDAGE